MEDEVSCASSAVLSRTLALGAAGCALSADRILSEGQPDFSSANRAVLHALLLCFEHLETSSALEANLSIISSTCEAVVIAQVASTGLAEAAHSVKVGDRDASRALVNTGVRRVRQELIAVARRAVVRRVARMARLAVRVALFTDTLILYRNIKWA